LNPNYFDRDQLYNLKNDPREKKNIAELNPSKSKEMQNKLIKALKSFPGRPYGEMVK
jgi:hypothetical protein